MALEFSIVSGALPPGLIGTTVGNSFVISGTPTTAGNFTFRLRVENEAGTFVEKDYTLNALAISAGSLPAANVGQPYSQTPNLVGFPAGDLTWAATGLPDGLSINPDTGEISGTPTSEGNFSFNVTASDSLGCTAQVEGGGTVGIEVVSGDPCSEGACPEETGTATTVDLLVDTGVNLDVRTPDPLAAGESAASWGNQDRGRYRFTYLEGAYVTGGDSCGDPGGLDDNAYKISQYRVEWFSSGSLQSQNWHSVICRVDQAAAETAMLTSGIFPSVSMDVSHTDAGQPLRVIHHITAPDPPFVNPIHGIPDPTWQLEQLQRQTDQLPRVRIQNFADLLACLDPCAGCADSGLTAWDGTFPAFSAPSFTITYGNSDVAAFNRSLNGKRLSQVRIQNMSFHPTSPTGAGWILSIRCDVDGFDSLLIWQGIKGVGNTAAGRYYRYDVNSPCSAGPACLVCEAY